MKLLVAAWRSIVQYFQGAYREFRQVTWPNRPTVVQYTILVTVTIVVSVIILTGFDYSIKKYIVEPYLLR